VSSRVQVSPSWSLLEDTIGPTDLPRCAAAERRTQAPIECPDLRSAIRLSGTIFDECRGETVGVRKQYHFWPGENGLDAWDVDRLVALSASFDVEEIDVGSIWELDTVYWFDERDSPTVRKVVEHARLIQEVELSYPIIVGPDGRVMDGMHRVARALLDGAATIRAVRFDVIPIPDFRNCRPDDLPYDE
jgi:hypothetical protein